MKIILLSGGSGKRLWPLSNNQRSKQFIKILSNEDHLESMVQRVWRQLEQVGLQDNTYIATGEAQRAILKSQLGIKDDRIITEPSRRDTFPAIALSASYLYSQINVEENETIVVLPVDPYVDTAFFKTVEKLETLLENSDITLGLIGIQPTIPSEKYGYILPSSSNRVKKFVEKPKREIALNLIENGAVWNAGVFSFKLATMLDLLRERNVPLNYFELSDNYELLPKNSFDYEFTEKQNNIAFLRYEGYWKDLGTWNTLTEEMDTQSIGFKTEMIDVSNTHVINETKLPIAVIGVEDLVVAAGPEGILISKKSESPRVKEIAEQFFESVSFIEEDWGVRHTIIENEKASATHYQIIDDQVLSISLNQNQNLIRLSGVGEIIKTGNHYKVTGKKDLNFIVVTEEQ